MFTTRLRLFRLLGIPIYVDASWFLILALLSWTLSVQFARLLEGYSPGVYWALGLGTALAFFGCIVLHELGHATVARGWGMPVRGITLFLFGGVMEMEGEPPSARVEFLVAIGGPVVSAVLALGFFLAGLAVAGLPGAAPWEAALSYLALINLSVLLFNLVPAFPLDGGRVLRSALWAALGSLRRATAYAAAAGRIFAWVLIGLGLLSLISGQLVGGLWLCMLGLFLNDAARASYEQVLIRQALRGEPVSRFMTRHVITVGPWVNLQEFVDDYVYRHHHKLFPVADGGRLLGWINASALAGVPRADWSRVTVGELMQTDLEGCCIPPETDALEALRRLSRGGPGRLLVVRGGEWLGIVSLRDLFRFLQLKLELEGEGDAAGLPVSRDEEEPALRG